MVIALALRKGSQSILLSHFPKRHLNHEINSKMKTITRNIAIFPEEILTEKHHSQNLFLKKNWSKAKN